MLKANSELVGEVYQLISVDPDRLIELGNKIKQMSMDSCIYRESVTVKFTDKIMFVYTPEKEFTKPVHTYTSSRAIISDIVSESVGGTA
jgi:hypothetical protein